MGKRGQIITRVARAPSHGELVSPFVHVFVDDQNLFWGIINDRYGKHFRIDFGRLLLEAARGPAGTARGVGSAYIAGVVPDDDYFWQVAKNQGFEVRRGFLAGAGNGKQRSKQDDSYLITEITATLYEKSGPATIVLVAGDADYVPPLLKAVAKGWRVEVVFIDRGVTASLEQVTHEFRELVPTQIQRYENFAL